MANKRKPRPAGQKQRIGAGDYETSTNRQQRKLVRVYDEWVSSLKNDLNKRARSGASLIELQALLDARIQRLEERLVEIQSKGIESAVKIGAGSFIDSPEVQRMINKLLTENTELIRGNLVPNIHEKLTIALATSIPAAAIGGLAIEQQRSVAEAIKAATLAGRSAPAQYAGGYWVAIFEVQKEAGQVNERQRIEQGLDIEPVRWVLDPRAVHCQASAGFFGCVDLAGEYPGGWSTLRTVPAGQVTCRGNCRCHIEVFRDGQWRRGIED